MRRHLLLESLNFFCIRAATAATRDDSIQPRLSLPCLRIYFGLQLVDLGLEALLLAVELSAGLREVLVYLFEFVVQHALNVFFQYFMLLGQLSNLIMQISNLLLQLQALLFKVT